MKFVDLAITKEITSNQEQVNKNLQLYVALWKKVNHGHEFIRTPLPSTSHNTIDYTLETFISEELRFALTTIQTLHKCFSFLNKMAKGQIFGDEKYTKISEELLSFKVQLNIFQIKKNTKKYYFRHLHPG